MTSAPGPGRRTLEAVFRAALAATAGEYCVADQLAAQPLSGPVSVIALGKAASAMALGSASALGAELQRGLVITKQGHIPPRLLEDRRFASLEAGHPLPDSGSLAAGQALLGFIAATPPGEQLLFLISGGTSSLVEVPLEGVGLDELVRLNHWLLGSGLDIAAMNRLRCAVSAIKGGKLLQHLGDRPATVMLISDVPGDDPSIIGSGLLIPPDGTRRLPTGLPDWVRQLVQGDDSYCRVPTAQPAVAHHIVARLQDALQAAAREARKRGYEATLVDAALHGDATTAGGQIAEFLRRQGPGIWLWGGETTVCLPEQPGRGGRNQSLALAAAVALQDHADCTLLAAGTDGTDGPTDAAGAIIDGGTVARGGGRQAALEALRHADAGSFLDASGDLLVTGPTGTNVTDLVIGLKTR